MTEIQLPNFEAAAERAVNEICLGQTLQPDRVRVIADHMRFIWQAENVAAEMKAQVRGDELRRQGRRDQADVCYGVAAEIRVRRNLVLGSPSTPF